MDNNYAYQTEDNYNVLPVENKSSFQNNPIQGNGSESQLDSINSKELVHSSQSSLNPIGLSNNSMNNSNSNKIKTSNDKSSFFNSNNNMNNNNIITEEDQTSTISEINPIDQDIIKTEMFDLTYTMIDINNFNNNHNKMKKDDFKSMSIKDKNNNDDLKNTIDLISGNYEREDINRKDNNSNKGDGSDVNAETHKIKQEIKKKIKQGWFPFFIQAEGFKLQSYWSKPDLPIKLGIEHYFKGINAQKNEYLFYYNNNLINIEKTIDELKLKKFGKIFGKLQ